MERGFSQFPRRMISVVFYLVVYIACTYPPYIDDFCFGIVLTWGRVLRLLEPHDTAHMIGLFKNHLSNLDGL